MESKEFYEERRRKIKADREAGMSGPAIAKKYGIKERNAYKIISTNGFVNKHKKPSIKETVTELYNSGKSIEDIQKITGHDRAAIDRIIHTLKVVSGETVPSDCGIPIKYRSKDKRSFRRITYQGTRYIDVTDFILENNDLTEARFH